MKTGAQRVNVLIGWYSKVAKGLLDPGLGYFHKKGAKGSKKGSNGFIHVCFFLIHYILCLI